MAIPVLDSLIGRLFGHLALPQLYSQPEGQSAKEKTGVARAIDRVELSTAAPQPLEAKLFEEAQTLARKLANGDSLTAAEQTRLREDRVFAAMVALTALGTEETAPFFRWPGGLPAPTKDELAAAYRRIRQRPRNLEDVRDPSYISDLRLRLIEAHRNADFGILAAQLQDQE